MTIKQYLDSLEAVPMKPTGDNTKSLAELMKEEVSIWSNNACKGYLIAAAVMAKIDDKKIKEMLYCIDVAFDEMTVEEAEKEYIDF